MADESRPPALARALLSASLPDESREEVLGDLEEQYSAQPSSRAALWYWRQAFLFSTRFTFSAMAENTGQILRAFAQPGWLHDLRHALRSMRRSWAFSLTAISILGIGLGAATAIFSIYYGILLRPFPYPSPDQLVRIDWIMPTGQSQGSSLTDLELWRRSSTSFSALGIYSTSSIQIRSDGPAETVSAAYVSSGTLTALGTVAQIGRMFSASEDVQGGDVHKAILSDSLWRRSFGRDAGVIGRTLRTDDKSLEVIGVMPPAFGFPDRTEIWIPVESRWANATVPSQRPIVKVYSVLGRLKASVSPERARDEIRAFAAATSADSQVQPRVRTLRQAETGQLRPYLIALLGGVVCLALICIANVSSLQLARGAAKQREFALRAALGASVGRNLRTQFAESALLASGGALLGSAVGILGVQAIASQIPVNLPSWMNLQVDWAALALCAGLAGASSLISGVLPAWRAVRQDPNTLLKAGGRGRTDRAFLRSGLVVGEIGLSTMLLVCALLMMQTLSEMQNRDPGFRSDGLLTIRAARTQPGNRIDRGRALSQLHAGVLQRLSAVPGVVSTSISNRLPFTSGGDSRTIADLTITGAVGDSYRKASFFGSSDVSPDYFTTMGIPLLRGRGFAQGDNADALSVVIINDRAAKVLWQDRDPVGQQVTWGTPRPENPAATVVGVVGNVRNFAAEADRGLEFYYPYAQYAADSVFYVLRTSVDPASLIQAARQTIQTAEPSIAVSAIKTMPQWIEDSLWQTRLWSWLFGAFAAIALLLAAIGLYGLVNYLVLLRSKEMVIRISLGATSGQIAGLVFGGMFRLVVLGVAAGVTGSLAVSRLIETLLFQVSPTDIRTYLVVSGMVAGIALVACFPPVFRTIRVSPVSVLKEE